MAILTFLILALPVFVLMVDDLRTTVPSSKGLKVFGKSHLKVFGKVHKGETSSKGLSAPSKRILALYRSLPERHRPDQDIVSMLRALDEKHGGPKNINPCFTTEYNFYWEGTPSRYLSPSQKSLISEYGDLKSSISDLHQSIKDQAYALKVAGLSHELDSIASLMNELRDESQLVKQVTEAVLKDS